MLECDRQRTHFAAGAHVSGCAHAVPAHSLQRPVVEEPDVVAALAGLRRAQRPAVVAEPVAVARLDHAFARPAPARRALYYRPDARLRAGAAARPGTLAPVVPVARFAVDPLTAAPTAVEDQREHERRGKLDEERTRDEQQNGAQSLTGRHLDDVGLRRASTVIRRFPWQRRARLFLSLRFRNGSDIYNIIYISLQIYI